MVSLIVLIASIRAGDAKDWYCKGGFTQTIHVFVAEPTTNTAESLLPATWILLQEGADHR